LRCYNVIVLIHQMARELLMKFLLHAVLANAQEAY